MQVSWQLWFICSGSPTHQFDSALIKEQYTQTWEGLRCWGCKGEQHMPCFRLSLCSLWRTWLDGRYFLTAAGCEPSWRTETPQKRRSHLGLLLGQSQGQGSAKHIQYTSITPWQNRAVFLRADWLPPTLIFQQWPGCLQRLVCRPLKGATQENAVSQTCSGIQAVQDYLKPMAQPGPHFLFVFTRCELSLGMVCSNTQASLCLPLKGQGGLKRESTLFRQSQVQIMNQLFILAGNTWSSCTFIRQGPQHGFEGRQPPKKIQFMWRR